jgi:hypothetical protein
MKRLALWSVFALGLGMGMSAHALPPDVRAGHWAAHGVTETLRNGVLAVDTDGKFHGEAKVTRAQAAAALAKLAQKLEADQWHAMPSVAVPESVNATLERGDWKSRPVTRYILASVLARFGDYVSHGVTRAPADSKDAGKSEILPDLGKPKLSSSQTANPALAYLAAHQEMFPKSPLLKAGSQTLTGAELSQAVSEMVVGLNDRLTSLGLDEKGDTPDKTFHKPKSPAKP